MVRGNDPFAVAILDLKNLDGRRVLVVRHDAQHLSRGRILKLGIKLGPDPLIFRVRLGARDITGQGSGPDRQAGHADVNQRAVRFIQFHREIPGFTNYFYFLRCWSMRRSGAMYRRSLPSRRKRTK